MKEKIKLGRELPEWMGHFFHGRFSLRRGGGEESLHAGRPGQFRQAARTAGQLDAANFTAAELENEFKTLAAATGQKVGALIHPARLAVSGRPVGPSLYHLLEVLGKARVLSRLDRAEKQFGPTA